jgi:autotransporter-associated beta strand protein
MRAGSLVVPRLREREAHYTVSPPQLTTIRVDNGVTTMIGAPIVGTGGLVVSGPGTLVVTANNAFSGGTTLAGGTLQLGNGGPTGTVAGNILITGTNTVLGFNHSGDYTFGGSITQTPGSSTSLSILGNATLFGPVTLTNAGNGVSSIAAGATLQTNGTFALAGGRNLNGAISFAGPSASISGPITGAGSALQLTGTTTFTASGVRSITPVQQSFSAARCSPGRRAVSVPRAIRVLPRTVPSILGGSRRPSTPSRLAAARCSTAP